MEVSGQLHAPATLPPESNGQEAGWAPESVWKLWRREMQNKILKKKLCIQIFRWINTKDSCRLEAEWKLLLQKQRFSLLWFGFLSGQVFEVFKRAHVKNDYSSRVYIKLLVSQSIL
jgi:hypothetical protein